MKSTTRAVLAYLAAHPGASVRELQRGCDLSSTSVVAHQLKLLADRGLIVATGPAKRARRWQVAQDTSGGALRAAVELALQRTERCGGYGVMPWVAIEAIREAL